MISTEEDNGKGSIIPPIWDHVLIFFIQAGRTARDARKFFNHFSKKDWLNKKGNAISNWKVTAWQWIWLRR